MMTIWNLTESCHVTSTPAVSVGLHEWTGVAIFMGVMYMVLVVCGVVGLLKRRGARDPRVFQVIFCTFLLVGSLTRTLYWALVPLQIAGIFPLNQQLSFFLADFPTFFFFSTYLVLLFFCAELYRSFTEGVNLRTTSSIGFNKYRRTFIVVNTLLYSAVGALYVVNYFIAPPWSLTPGVTSCDTLMQIVILLFGAVLYMIFAVGFILYGILLYARLSHLRLQITTRSTILFKVGFLSSFVTVCFLSRSIVVFWGAFQPALNWASYFTGGFYLVLEILPLLIILYILHSKNESDAAEPFTPQKKPLLGYGNVRTTNSINSTYV